MLGNEFSNRYGIRCYPATDNRTGNRFVAKVQTFPYSQSVTEAFLLSGVFQNENEVFAYYHDLAKDLCRQAAILNALSHTAYFSHYTSCEIVKNDSEGYDVLLISPFYTTLAALFEKATLNHQQVLDLGITLCRALSICREAGFLYTGIKPENIFVTGSGKFMIGDIGFVPLPSMPYAALPLRRYTVYTPADCHDCYCRISDNLDVYGVGVILYQACCGGIVPERITTPPQIDNKILAEIIMTACLPASDGRWKNPSEMEAALLSCQSEGIKQ
jgi:serine/threonine protein kinase